IIGGWEDNKNKHIIFKIDEIDKVFANEDNDNEKEEKDEEEESFTIKKPYIILLGISEYNKKENNLNGVKKVINNLYDLFTNKNNYNYNKKYAFKNLDKITYYDSNKREDVSENITKDNLETFFAYHCSHISSCKNQIDSFIFIYSGHGNVNGILPIDYWKTGEEYTYNNIYNKFNNQNNNSLKNKIKIF